MQTGEGGKEGRAYLRDPSYDAFFSKSPFLRRHEGKRREKKKGGKEGRRKKGKRGKTGGTDSLVLTHLFRPHRTARGEKKKKEAGPSELSFSLISLSDRRTKGGRKQEKRERKRKNEPARKMKVQPLLFCEREGQNRKEREGGRGKKKKKGGE